MNIKELIFNIYKNESIGARKFRAIVSKKYKLTDIEISNIYAKINNYQTSKYGARLGKSTDIELKTKEEYKLIAQHRRTARYQRLNRRGN